MIVRRFGRLSSYTLIGFIALAILFVANQAHADEFRLSGEVTIQYDTFGVAHITASNDADLYFAQGYVTARDRLWQMEYTRRLASGRLAEILGESYIDQDFEMRRLGFHAAAVATYESLAEEEKRLASAYAAGVNYYINATKENLPREFQDLEYTPELWHPVDSLMIPLLMFWELSGSMEEELMLAKLINELGASKALELVSGQPADPETHIAWQQAGALIPKGLGKGGFEILSHLKDFSAGPSALRFVGSNNWVVDGVKSATGAPILANDPHLELLNPPIWYEVHLMGPGVNVIGSTFPGVQGVIIGHNEHIAWGVTNVGYDVCDLYVETLSADDPNLYIFRSETKPFKKVTETIKYKSGDEMKSVDKEIRYTVHGPVVEEEDDGTVLTMRWTGHESSTEMRFMYLLNRASNVEEFRQALTYYRLGAQNFIYADIDGNIFYQPTGAVPIRNGAPYLPLDGSSGEFEWESYIPYDDLPRTLNPEEHFIATANARPVGDSYPYYIGYFFDIGYRVRRIKDLLMSKETLTFEDVRAIQADNYVMAAERLKPMLMEAIERERARLPERTIGAAEYVGAWDNHATTDSVACTIFNKWLERIAWNTLRDDLSDDSFEYWASNPDIIVVLLVRSSVPDTLQFNWFDNPQTARNESKAQVIALSLQEAVDELTMKYGYDMDQWLWGKIHTITLEHGLGEQNHRYNNGPHPRGGSNDTIDNAWFPFFQRDFRSDGGPSLRMTVELTPGVEHAANTIPGGQSGNQMNPHYQDQLIDLWLKHKVHPMLFSREQIQANAAKTMKLVPTKPSPEQSE